MFKTRILVLLSFFYFNAALFSQITKKDVLSINKDHFMLNGKPFAEISFNKFDLFWSLWDEAVKGNELNDSNPVVMRQEKALSDLSKAGFKTIRFFGLVHESRYKQFYAIYTDPQKRKSIYYQALDKAIELLERNHIKAVFSLGCATFVNEWDGDNLRELVANPQSSSRKTLYGYIDDIVTRYKNCPAILMWEVTNELTLIWDIQPGTLMSRGKRMPTMDDGIRFYKDISTRIRQNDPLRLVSGGGSILRESAYHLNVDKTWGKDSYSQQLEMYLKMYDNAGLDVMDIHYYTTSLSGYLLRDEKTGGEYVLDLNGYAGIAKYLKKPLYVGEFGALPKPVTNKEFWGDNRRWFTTFGKDEPDAIKFVQRAADIAINSGATLIHWWCYQSDRQQDQKDSLRMDLDITRTPELFKIVVDANKRLKEKFNIH
jgi:hypothetical protein